MLSHYRVLDLTDGGSLICGQILGDLGADVIVVEPPAGASIRHSGWYAGNESDPNRSLSWWALNRNRRGVTLDSCRAYAPAAEKAQRELAEETGYRARHWEKLHEFFLSPGVLDERMHLFLARVLELGTPAREANEQIENLVLPWSEAMRMVADGRIHDAKTLIALLLYDRLRGAKIAAEMIG